MADIYGGIEHDPICRACAGTGEPFYAPGAVRITSNRCHRCNGSGHEPRSDLYTHPSTGGLVWVLTPDEQIATKR